MNGKSTRPALAPGFSQSRGLSLIFGLLLVVTAGGIIYHYLSGYHYPATPAFSFELNVLGDLYELFFLVPAGLIGLLALRRGVVLGPLLIAGVASNLTYNYAMATTGRQNLWIFLWTLKLALAGTTVALVWKLLPKGPARRSQAGLAIAGYFGLTLLIFGKMMGQRLLASALGRTMDMTMQGAGVLDWGEPFLRDPIIFFALACPVMLTAILGLYRGTEWGGRAASLSGVFIVSIVSLVLFTGPLKEYLQTGSISPAMRSMSAIMVLAAAISVWAVMWLARGERRV